MMSPPRPGSIRQPPVSGKTCPICRRPRSASFAPFCSSRCRDRDLARWFGEGYALPGPPASAQDQDEPD